MRSILRTIRANQVNFELQRYAVRIAAQQIVLNEDIRQINEALSQASGPTAARDTVSALQDLLDAQNFFMGVWVNYEVLRRTLDQELGTMQLDSEGLWVDPGPLRPDTVGGEFGPQALMLEETTPVNLPEQAASDVANNQQTDNQRVNNQQLPADTIVDLAPNQPPGPSPQPSSPETLIRLPATQAAPSQHNPNSNTSNTPGISLFPSIPRPQEPVGLAP
jgi:hypothetical protein